MRKKLILLLVMLLSLCGTAYGYVEKIPVLLYHMVEPAEAGLDVIVSITPESLRMQLETIRDNGFTPITFTDYYSYAAKNEKLPDKPVIITFDDGYTNNYTYLFPLLKEFKMKATIFIVTDSVGQTPGLYPHFTWEQAAEMEKSGLVDIQSHTHSHENVTQFNEEELVRELRLSRFLIEQKLNKKCEFLAFPYGFYDTLSLAQSRAAGYKLTAQVANDTSVAADSLFMPIKRITTWGSLTSEQLLELLN